MSKAAPKIELWTIEVFRLKGHDGVGEVVQRFPMHCSSNEAKALVNRMVRRFFPLEGDAARLLDKNGEEKHRRTWWDEQGRLQVKNHMEQVARIAKERAEGKRPELKRRKE